MKTYTKTFRHVDSPGDYGQPRTLEVLGVNYRLGWLILAEDGDQYWLPFGQYIEVKPKQQKTRLG